MVPIGGAEPQFSDAASQSLVQELRQGGYVVLVRHMSTGPTKRISTRNILRIAPISGS
jgi:hypothetical protein